MNHWIASKVDNVIIALQHHCGVNGRAVNCLISARGNWECPNCLTTYGAPFEMSLANAYTTEQVAADESEGEA